METNSIHHLLVRTYAILPMYLYLFYLTIVLYQCY
nr:MAG TPA: hypothetical protein [Caudoviricetes sp.]DAS44988.1 MAG TPA: hypothetical protein [Caudoviricetes sp.]